MAASGFMGFVLPDPLILSRVSVRGEYSASFASQLEYH